MTDFVNLISKHGITGLLCVCLFWMNSRLSDVEARLYDCYDDATYRKSTASANKVIPSKDKLVAILPKELEIKKESDENHILSV
jgi:hypothetical protein